MPQQCKRDVIWASNLFLLSNTLLCLASFVMLTAFYLALISCMPLKELRKTWLNNQCISFYKNLTSSFKQSSLNNSQTAFQSALKTCACHGICKTFFKFFCIKCFYIALPVQISFYKKTNQNYY